MLETFFKILEFLFINVHLPLKRLSLLKSVNFLCLQPLVAFISKTFS